MYLSNIAALNLIYSYLSADGGNIYACILLNLAPLHFHCFALYFFSALFCPSRAFHFIAGETCVTISFFL